MLSGDGAARVRHTTLTRRRLIGAGVLLAALLIAWLGITKPNPFAYHEDVEVMFDHVQGLALVQRDVRVAGVNVGRIGSARRVGAHAEVELVLSQRIPIYRDATAALRPHTPFEGTTFIDLDPGTPGAGLLGDRPIPLSQTSVFVSAGDVLSTFTAPVRQGFQTIVGQLSVALDARGRRGLRGALDSAPELLRDTADVAPELRGAGTGHRDVLSRLIPETARTVDALAGGRGELRRAARDAATTLDAVTTGGGSAVQSTLTLLPQTLADAHRASTDASQLIAAARATAAGLTPTLRQIPGATPPITRLLHQAAPVLSGSARPIDSFARTLTGVARTAPRFGRLLQQFYAIAGPLRHRLVPALDAPTQLGLPTYLQVMAALTGFTGVLDTYVTPAQVGGRFATGHVLRGTLQAPVSLPLAALDLPCSVIAKLNQNAVPLVEGLGLCTR